MFRSLAATAVALALVASALAEDPKLPMTLGSIDRKDPKGNYTSSNCRFIYHKMCK